MTEPRYILLLSGQICRVSSEGLRGFWSDFIANYRQAEEGCADTWIVAPALLARCFSSYKLFVLESLAGVRDYVTDFTSRGWLMTLQSAPRSLAKMPLAGAMLARNFGHRNVGMLQLAYSYVCQRLKNWHNRLLGTIPKPRFLDVSDFATRGDGYMINPVSYALVIYSHSSCANLKFSSVSGDQLVGNYMLVNNFFPHVANAIAKGKWCISEWSAEMGHLAGEHKINLNVRGVN